MPAEFNEELRALMGIASVVLVIWGAYGFVLAVKAIFGGSHNVHVTGEVSASEKTADNIYTKQAASELAKGNEATLEAARINLRIENSQRERAGLPPLR